MNGMEVVIIENDHHKSGENPWFHTWHMHSKRKGRWNKIDDDEVLVRLSLFGRNSLMMSGRYPDQIWYAGDADSWSVATYVVCVYIYELDMKV